MREGEYEYIHEFKERINEILSLQKKHHEIIDSATEPTTVKQASLAELHRLNITLSNYFDVAPSIIGNTISVHNKQLRQQQEKQNLSSNFDFKILQKPFWVWNQKEHLVLAKESDGQCCWNHIVGLPVKNKKEHALFDYEKGLFDTLLFSGVNNPSNQRFKHKHIWVKKSTGLGVTEFMLRMMAWFCTSTEDKRFRNSQMCIITGPNIEMAIKLIKRIKANI